MPASVTPNFANCAPDHSVSPGNSPTTECLLFKAVAAGDLEGLKALLNMPHGHFPLDTSVQDSEGRTPLFLAVETGHRAAAKLLLQAGGAVNVADAEGQTPLMRAAAACDSKLVHWLLKAGAEVNAVSADGDTAMILAAGATHWVAVDAGAAVQGIVRQTPEGPMQLRPLPQGRIVSILSRLLKHGANPNLEHCSATPLMEAARYGQPAVLRFLLDAGADPRVTASDGETALDIAKIYNQPEAIALLQAVASAS